MKIVSKKATLKISSLTVPLRLQESVGGDRSPRGRPEDVFPGSWSAEDIRPHNGRLQRQRDCQRAKL